MFNIESDNTITVVKGDTGIIDLALDNYSLSTGDTAYFSVKKSLQDSNYALQKIVTSFTDGVAKFQLSSSDTNLTKGNYNYDVQVSLSDGRVDTVVIGKFRVTAGVTD